MSKPVQLVLVIHNHQPVGNFDHVIHEACDKAYLPFLRMLLDFPAIRIGLHTSGCLLEWLEQHRTEYFDLVRELLRRGQIELIGGGMYEPILPVLDEASARLQLAKMKGYLHQTFGRRVSGMWTPERVWEPSMPGIISDYYDYTLLDDFHFLGNAHHEDVARGYFETGDVGSRMFLLPIAKQLRYAIPFMEPEATLAYLRNLAFESETMPVAIFGDDGEKFGVWPETYEWVYAKGWMQRFLTALTENSDWVQLTLPEELLENHTPRGDVNIPCRSYMEMGEWTSFDDITQKDYMPGHWRNFLVKYPEVNDMRNRTELVFRRASPLVSAWCPNICGWLDDIKYEASPRLSGSFTYTVDHPAFAPLVTAIHELLRAQCNCPYWHGVFGGVYLNYLRASVTQHLLSAEMLLDASSLLAHGADGGEYVVCIDELPTVSEFFEKPDFRENPRAWEPHELCIGTYEYLLVSPGHLVAWADAHHGLCLRRLDYYPSLFCWTDVLARRREHYHHKLEELAERGELHVGEEHASIHDRVVVKEEGLEKHLVIDPHQRVSFVSYFSDVSDPDWFMTVPDPASVQPRFTYRDFNLDADAENRAGMQPALVGKVDHGSFAIRKSIELDSGELLFRISLQSGTVPQAAGLFWIEFNLTVLTDQADDRYMEVDGLRQPLSVALGFDSIERVALVDEWQGRRIWLSCPGAKLFTYPVHTVSSSEGGFERTYQGTCIMLGYPPQALLEQIDLRLGIEELKA